MRAFSRLSLRKKLMWLLLLTSSSALLLSVAGFAIHDWLSLRHAVYERLQAQAGIIGHNSIAALTFDDPDAAYDTLTSLRQEADILGAALYTRDGARFAAYQRPDAAALPATLPPPGSGTLDEQIYVVSPIVFDEHLIGHVMIVSDLSAWQKRQRFHLLITLAVFVVALLFAWLLSSRLHQLVSEPILQLAATARRVSQQRDYRLRAIKYAQDEIGLLVDDFNEMLRQIELRDHELQQAHDYLEARVAARTQELTELTQQLEHLAYHDNLTGLANRITFEDHLRLAIDQAQRHHQRFAVFFLDLDRFKLINDTLGHDVGDKLLITIARRLTTCLRQSDTLARLGGDEFAILLPQLRHDTDAAEIAHKIIQAITAPLEISGYHLHITTSIGISLFPEDGDSVASLVKNADTAMYRSKDSGRNQYTFFSADMHARATRRMFIENKLREALARDALTVFYQPRCDARSQRIVSVEALARWFDEDEGVISPAEFIPIAEECGLIARIDEWVLATACREMMAENLLERADLTLAVNLSPAQFIREDLYALIADTLQRVGFPATRLELEITESLFGPGNVDACSVLTRLRDLGVALSIDDFGTAYSSLSRLKQLPINTLKIDQSFVRHLGHDADDEILVKTIITMAHNLNLKVIAEGVETETQYRFVQQHGCDSVQGFLFGKPMPYAQLVMHLHATIAS